MTEETIVHRIATGRYEKFKCIFGGCPRCPHYAEQFEELISTNKRCFACSGRGRVKEQGECDCCDGSGEHTIEAECGAEVELECTKCEGTGDIDVDEPCSWCRGTGKKLIQNKIILTH